MTSGFFKPIILFMDKKTRLYIVRHGQVKDYDRFPAYGHTDVDITQIGIMQMETLAQRLKLTDIGVIYSSDLKRSIKGAQIINQFHNVPHYIEPEFKEINFGDWEGLSLSEIREQFPNEMKKRMNDPIGFTPPGNGESVEVFSRRIINHFKSIIKKQNGKDILLIGHGVVNRVIISDALCIDFSQMFKLQQNYGCLNIIDYFSDSTLVRLING